MLLLPRSLPDLSAFTRLTSLVLDGNELSSAAFKKFPPLKALDTLSINKNKLTNVDHVLKGVSSLRSLRYLLRSIFMGTDIKTI